MINYNFSKHVYFGEMQGGYRFDYSPTENIRNGANYDSQITFLRLLSTQARQVSINISRLWFFSTFTFQTVTYHCNNSVAYFDKANRDYAQALKLLGSNGVEFTAEGAEPYTVIEDGCATGGKDKTVIQYASKKTARLPIVVSYPFI